MLKIFKISIVCVIMFVSFSMVCFASEGFENFADLVEKGKGFDGKTIILKGEAIGESMKRGDFAWVNITDGTLPMGIWMKSEDAQKIGVFGDYKHKGDIVEVKGIFNKTCTQHGGDMDLHAEDVKVVSQGYVIPENINKNKGYAAVELSIATLTLAGIYFGTTKKVNR